MYIEKKIEGSRNEFNLENMLYFAMAISPWSAKEITVILLQMEVNMDIDASPRKRFEIIGGNPIVVWTFPEMADLKSNCTLCQMTNRILC